MRDEDLFWIAQSLELLYSRLEKNSPSRGEVSTGQVDRIGNLIFLNNALAQTGWQASALTISNWREQVRKHLHGLGWKAVHADVRSLFKPGFDLELLTWENLERVLG